MTVIRPFRAILPHPELAARVVARPYDVLSAREAEAIARENPDSFYHVSKPEIHFPQYLDAHTPFPDEVYEEGARWLRKFLDCGILQNDTGIHYYVYTQRMPHPFLAHEHIEQTGLVCVSALSDYEEGIIKKHELTRPDKELDRIQHIRFTRAQTGNVFLAHRPLPILHALLEKWKDTHRPAYHFQGEDGVEHLVWKVDHLTAIAQITRIFEHQIPCTYIADGHHRAASAALLRKEWMQQAQAHAAAPYQFFLTTLFSADQLFIMEYNRLVKDLNGLSPETFLEKLTESFVITDPQDQVFRPRAPHQMGMYLQQRWYGLTVKPGLIPDDAVESLDVSLLQRLVLMPLLGIENPRTDERIEFAGGIRGASYLETKVNSGEMAVAFLLHPVTADQLFAVADAGKMMPPKSTWFEPKLPDGLFIHSLDEAEIVHPIEWYEAQKSLF
ncbi:MAG: DUF1015 domain-containing protein [Thermoflavifilum sp.]|nr:DUF1015 domain-containing protein [Thermoflavifilum sp.]